MRSLVRAPGFAAIAVFTLALAMGASTAFFSVLDVVALRPLPYTDPDAIVDVRLLTRRGDGDAPPGLPLDALDALRAEPTLFRGIAGWRSWKPTVTGVGEPAILPAAEITEGLLVRVLGVQPTLGRSFAPEEHRADGARTVVLAHAFWRDRMGADAGVLGRALVLDDVPYTIIGVMPERFRPPFAEQAAVWTSARLGEPCNRLCPTVQAIGRLESGVTLPVARDRVAAVLRVLAETRPEEYGHAGIEIIGLRDELYGAASRALGLLVGALVLVLLIASTNVAALQLVRAEGRREELAVRRALGANRTAIVRQLAVESGVLALGGGCLGLALAAWGTEALVALAPRNVPGLDEVEMNARVLGLTALAVLGSGLLSGLAPAIRTGRSGVPTPPRGPSRPGIPRRPWIGVLVVGQVALATVLLVSAGVLLRSLRELRATELGFEPEGVLAVNLDLPVARFAGASGRLAFYHTLMERLADEPAVVTVGATSALPLTAEERFVVVAAENLEEEGEGGGSAAGVLRIATPGYFYTMGQRIVDGRAFDEADDATATPVAVVNETLARALFDEPRLGAIGRRVRIDPAGAAELVMVVGVVGDTRQADVREAPAPALYVPFAQRPVPAMTLVLRVDGDPVALADAARDAVARLDGSLAALSVGRLSDVVDETLRGDRFATRLLGMLATCALLLAAVGLYGVVAHGTVRRLRELGIRLALGAASEDVRRLALRVGLGLAGAGIALGLVGSVLVAGMLESLLFAVSPLDPLTLLGTAVVLGASALAAAWMPARRAGAVDPVSVLREE